MVVAAFNSECGDLSPLSLAITSTKGAAQAAVNIESGDKSPHSRKHPQFHLLDAAASNSGFAQSGQQIGRFLGQAAVMQFPAVARRRGKDHGGNRGSISAIVHGGLGPHDVKGGRKGVGLRGRGRQDRDRKHALGRPAGARVEDVAIAPSPMAKRLELRPRRAQGPVVQLDLPQPPLMAERILDADRPGRPSSWQVPKCVGATYKGTGRRAAGGDAAISAVDEKVGNAGGQQMLRRAIDRVALADAAEVQPHSRAEEADRASRFIEFDPLAAHQRPGLGQLLGRGNGPGPAGKAPGFPEGRGREVVGPAAIASRVASPAGSSANSRGSTSTAASAAWRLISEMSLSGLKNDNCPSSACTRSRASKAAAVASPAIATGQANLELAGHRLAGEMDQVGFVALGS